MPDFEFSATAECERCGTYLSSSTEECDNCANYERTRYRFFHISEDRVETVWAITAVRAWKVLGDQVGREESEILPWELEHRGMSLHYAQMGHDVTDEDSLRQPNLPR